jgi:hypothetical protein
MKRFALAALKVIAMLAVAALATTPSVAQTSDEHATLDRPFHPLFSDAGRHPLVRAIRSLSGPTMDTFLDFGIELNGDESSQPMVVITSAEGLSVGQTLERILAQAPDYDFQVKSAHFISVAPKRMRSDPADLLNLKVARFDVEGVQSGKILTWPESVIPELMRVMYPDKPGDPQAVHVYMGLGVSIGPLVTLHLRDTTVREILDAVSIETEIGALKNGLALGWLSTMEHKKDLTPTLKWQLLTTAPGNWKQLRTDAHTPTP